MTPADKPTTRRRAWTEADDPDAPPPVETVPHSHSGESSSHPQPQSGDMTVDGVTMSPPAPPDTVAIPRTSAIPHWTLERAPGLYNCWCAVRLEGGIVAWRGPIEPAAYAAQRAANAIQLWAYDQVGRPAADWPGLGHDTSL